MLCILRKLEKKACWEHALLCMVVRPEVVIGERAARPLLDGAQRRFLMDAMRALPAEAPDVVDPGAYPADYNKFFHGSLCAGRGLAVYNKLGRALGFSVENAYAVGPAGSFFLSARIETNANGVVNDDQYEYEVADAFMERLAAAVAARVMPGGE